MQESHSIETPIFTVRGQRVILDADLARLYKTTTSALNQAVKRNADRFPDDFAFQLTALEVRDLRSQIVIMRSQPAETEENNLNWSQFAISSLNRLNKVYRPWVFSEHGALMAANILRSDDAVHMSIYVVRAFIKQREQLAANQTILKRLAEIDKTLLQQDAALRDIYRKLLPLLQPPPDPPRRRIGFITDETSK